MDAAGQVINSFGNFVVGGNYAVDFVFNGVRGYEAVGQLGFIFGLIGGGLLCWWIVFRPSRRKKYQE